MSYYAGDGVEIDLGAEAKVKFACSGSADIDACVNEQHQQANYFWLNEQHGQANNFFQILDDCEYVD
jgi:hypothetical protein